MFGLTALELARIQFGFTISFHIIFPAITIGLAELSRTEFHSDCH
jgi:cytochrome d ubiquinol oxidase subunit I